MLSSGLAACTGSLCHTALGLQITGYSELLDMRGINKHPPPIWLLLEAWACSGPGLAEECRLPLWVVGPSRGVETVGVTEQAVDIQGTRQ